MNSFKKFLSNKYKSSNTMETYLIALNSFLKWYSHTYGLEMKILHKETILDFISYMKTIKESNAKTLRLYIHAIETYAEYIGQKDITKNIEKPKIQEMRLNPTEITQHEVDKFRQIILQETGKRNYTIVTIMAYAGLRISEVLNIKINDFNIQTREILIREGKGDKQRIAYMNDKIINALREYLKERNTSSKYLFISNRKGRIHRTTINKIFNKYSDIMTPHQLRHFFCTHCLENDFSVHEVAMLAGHQDINTTIKYTHPSIDKIKNKINKL